jgi:putative transposase
MPPLIVVTGGLRVGSGVFAEDVDHALIVTAVRLRGSDGCQSGVRLVSDSRQTPVRPLPDFGACSRDAIVGRGAWCRVRKNCEHISRMLVYSTVSARSNLAVELDERTMARKPRVFIPGVSVHVIHRGNNRGAIVRDDRDRCTFMSFLRRTTQRHELAVHGFVLMDTHYHLLATPADANCLAGAMKELGERYVRYFNDRHHRSGTLWNGRYRGLPVYDDRYWLTCLRYIEQNPVRARMVRSPDAFRWSSYRVHALGEESDWLTLHWLYLALGSTPQERQMAYRAICDVAVTPSEMVEQRLAWRPASTVKNRGLRLVSDPP